MAFFEKKSSIRLKHIFQMYYYRSRTLQGFFFSLLLFLLLFPIIKITTCVHKIAIYLFFFSRYPLNVLEERGLSENPILYQFDTTPVFVAIPSKYNIAVSIGSFTLHTFSEDNLDTSSIRAIHTCKEQQCISRDIK